MINNRQSGRRRGRGGQRGQNLGGQPGNRQDNRQRGNAAQLLEKYKNMARDAQLSGDRVQTEYYLQFADHYHRVLSESRARFDDQNQRRQRDDDLDEDDDSGASMSEADFQRGDEESSEGRDHHGSGDGRGERPERFERSERHGRERPRRRFDREERARDEQLDDTLEATQMNGGNGSLPLDVLPPAIGTEDASGESEGEQPAPRPRRRSRGTPPADGEDEVAPAA